MLSATHSILAGRGQTFGRQAIIIASLIIVGFGVWWGFEAGHCPARENSV
jgi:hypothetical protein